MSKRKKADPSLEDDNEDEDNDNESRGKSRQQPQKVYDFHKKTIEVYPERLRELNRQFLSSVSSQINTEPYSVLVANCLDYVRQYFTYEDDLLKYSPWLATRLKQSNSDILKCLQGTIDVYDALARQDFDRLFDKAPSDTRSTPNDTIRLDAPAVSTAMSFPVRVAPTPVTTAALPSFNFTKPASTTADSPASTGFNFKLPAATPEKSTSSAPFAFSIPSTGFGTSTFGTSTSSASSISFGSPAKFSFSQPAPTTDGDSAAAATEENEDESSEPPEPEKVNHEADAKLTYRCRMGVNKNGKLIKRGSVQVILKEANDKHQLIVRSDDTLGRLYLNIIWSKNIEPKKHSTKDLTFVCKLNPSMPEVKEGEFVMILFRFDSDSERDEAFANLDKERT